MREEFASPLVGQRVEERTNVILQHIVHAPPRQGDRERIQGVVRTASRPEPRGEAPKILLVNLMEDGHHGLLDNLILQRGDPHWTSSPIGLRDVDSPCGVRPLSSAVNSAVEVN